MSQGSEPRNGAQLTRGRYSRLYRVLFSALSVSLKEKVLKKYTKEEVYQIRKGNLVVVARTGCYEDWDVIKYALRVANRGEEHG